MNGADAVSREEAIEVIRSKAQRYCLSKESSYMGIVEWSDSLIPTEEAVDALKGLRCIDQPKTDTWSIKEVAKALEKHGLARSDQEPCEDCISRQAVEGKLKALVNEMETIFADIRESKVDDSVCGLCEYDCDHGIDGYANECPGFERDDCFKLKDEYRKEWESVNELPSVRPQEPYREEKERERK